MDALETLKIIGLMMAPAFFSLLGMAALGCPAVAVLAELGAKLNKKVFYDKYGQQTGAMGLLLLVLLILIYGAAIGLSLQRHPWLIDQLLDTSSPFFLGNGLLGAFALAGVIYYLTWKSMRQAKGIHIILGLIAALSAVGAVAVTTPAKLLLNLTQGTPSQEALDAVSALSLPLSAMYGVLTLAAAAALSLMYLIIRRNKDDYGRDYYFFSIKLAARWATLPMIGFLACQGWLYAQLPGMMRTMILGTPLAYVWAGIVLFGCLSVCLWIFLARSVSPLRLKGLAFLAVFLLWIMHALNATLFINLMTML